MTEAKVIFNDPEPGATPSPIAHTLFRLSKLDLPAKEHFESYLHHKARANHKQRTIESSFTSIRLFLEFYGTLGRPICKISSGLIWRPSSSTSRTGACTSPR